MTTRRSTTRTVMYRHLQPPHLPPIPLSLAPIAHISQSSPPTTVARLFATLNHNYSSSSARNSPTRLITCVFTILPPLPAESLAVANQRVPTSLENSETTRVDMWHILRGHKSNHPPPPPPANAIQVTLSILPSGNAIQFTAPPNAIQTKRVDSSLPWEHKATHPRA